MTYIYFTKKLKMLLNKQIIKKYKLILTIIYKMLYLYNITLN